MVESITLLVIPVSGKKSIRAINVRNLHYQKFLTARRKFTTGKNKSLVDFFIDNTINIKKL